MSTRRCGLCREQGHDKRRCPNAERVRIEKEEEEERCRLRRVASAAREAREQIKIRKQLATLALIEASSLSYYPRLTKAKMDVYSYLWTDRSREHENRCRMKSLTDWTKTLKDVVFDPKHPATNFYLLFPLSFWVAMVRELTYVIPKEYNKLVVQLLTSNSDVTLTGCMINYNNKFYKTHLPDMIQISSSCVNKMVPETRLSLKLLPEHVRHVLSYL